MPPTLATNLPITWRTLRTRVVRSHQLGEPSRGGRPRRLSCEAQLQVDIPEMAFHGADAEIHLRSDLLVAPATRDQAHHLELPLGQRLRHRRCLDRFPCRASEG